MAATELPVLTISMAAGAAITQFYFVKMSANRTVSVCAATTDKPIGIAQTAAAAAGDRIEVMITGISKVSADAELTYDDSIGTAADGQAAPYTVTDTTKYIVGQVIEGVSSAAELATVAIDCTNPRVLA